MAVDERARHELYLRAEAAMGSDGAETLMSLLPPVGWADVATKHDLRELERRLDLRFVAVEQRLEAMGRDLVDMRGQISGMAWRLFAIILTLVPALVVPLVVLR